MDFPPNSYSTPLLSFLLPLSFLPPRPLCDSFLCQQLVQIKSSLAVSVFPFWGFNLTGETVLVWLALQPLSPSILAGLQLTAQPFASLYDLVPCRELSL